MNNDCNDGAFISVNKLMSLLEKITQEAIDSADWEDPEGYYNDYPFFLELSRNGGGTIRGGEDAEEWGGWTSLKNMKEYIETKLAE